MDTVIDKVESFLKDYNYIFDENYFLICEDIKSYEVNYIDITSEWLKNIKSSNHKVKDRGYFEHNGIKYNVNGKDVILDYSTKEKEVASWLRDIFDEEIYMLPKINKPEGIQTADYLFKNEYWDLKEIFGNGKNVLFHAIEGHEKQAKNFVFDVTKSTLTDIEIMERIRKLYSLKKLKWLDKVIIKRENKVIKIIKRSDPSD